VVVWTLNWESTAKLADVPKTYDNKVGGG